MNNEIWKDIKGYEGTYQISNLGRVKSLERIVVFKDGRKRLFKEQIRQNVFNKKRGYFYITFKKSNSLKTISIHKLVADNFLGFQNGKVVDHIDNDRTNNKLSNLRFVTQRENLSKKEDSGICYHIRNKKWTAYIWIKDKIKHLGYYKTKEEAKAIRLKNLNELDNE